MRERIQKPFGAGGDIGLRVSGTGGSGIGPAGANDRAGPEWRISGGRGRRQSSLPHIGPVLLAIVVVAAITYGLHRLFI